MLRIDIESALNLTVAAASTAGDAHGGGQPHGDGGGGGGKGTNKVKMIPDTICVLKFCGREFFRTSPVMNKTDPQYNETFSIRVENLISKEKENCRPFYMEYFDVEILDLSRVNLGEKIGEIRVPLYKTGFHSYKVVKLMPSNIASDDKQYDVMAGGRLNVKLSYEDIDSNLLKFFYKIELSKVLSPYQPHYQQLYLNFKDTSPSSFVGLTNLPGPTVGEVILDRHTDIEYNVTTHVNAFGDRTIAAIRGSLILTDIRLIFVPHGLWCPLWLRDFMNIDEGHLEHLSEQDIFSLRRLTIQIPIGSIDESKCLALDLTSANIQVSLRDGSIFLFTVKKSAVILKKHRMGFVDHDSRREANLKKDLDDLKSFAIKTGFVTASVMPQVWCNRVSDEINWMVKEDTTWIRWLSYLKRSVESLNIDKKHWMKENDRVITYENDYQRQRVQDGNWVLSESNQTYMLCQSYPRVLVFPDVISEEELLGAAADRSIGRLPALVWMHPDNKAALCRSAQPMSGIAGTMSGMSGLGLAGNGTDGDKKLCLAIKAQCPSGLPLRIADARPSLNANANALLGKGIENIDFFGGPSVAVLAYLDIENIHVVKASYMKLKEGLLNPSKADSDDVVVTSKWLYHIASILKGAVSVAESLIIGHPVLIHCSDGWDRTSQLSALAQLLLDPYYRTLQGFLLLWNKEFVSFGHQFECRLGKYKSTQCSQIFVQFCDCIWQILNQNPNEFEFTPYLITLILQSAYSGLFSTFRCDNEQKKNAFMKRAVQNSDISLLDLHFSSLFTYIEILLKCPVYQRLIINPFYSPKTVKNSLQTRYDTRFVSYISPRFSVNNLSLWREGILCFSPDITTSLNLRVNVKPSESISISASRMAKEMLCNRIHSSVSLYDKLNSFNFFDEQSQRVSNHKTLLSILRDQVSVMLCAADGFTPLTMSVLIIQSWWRTQRETKRLITSMETSIDIKNVWVDVLELETRDVKLVKSLKKFIKLLSFHRYLLNAFEGVLRKKSKFDLVREVVRDILDDALHICIHTDEISRQNVLQSLTDMIANSNQMMNGTSSDRIKSGGFLSSFSSNSSKDSTSSNSNNNSSSNYSSSGGSQKGGFTLSSMWK